MIHFCESDALSTTRKFLAAASNHQFKSQDLRWLGGGSRIADNKTPNERMNVTRRNFLSAAATAGAMSLVPADSAFGAVSKVSDQALEKAAAKPVLDLESFKEPIIIESIQLLKK